MIEFTQNPRGQIRIWKMPERSKRYLIPADVSEGLEGGNFSCAHVIENESFEQVAVWHGMSEPYEFGRTLFNLGMYYNGGMLAPERNNNGITVIDYLRSNNYPNIFRMVKFDYILVEETERLGFMTNAHTRPLILDALKEAIRSQSIKLNDPDTIAELRTFVRNPRTGKVEAALGSFDDRVISLGIGCYIRRLYPETVSISTMRDDSYLDRLKARWNDGKIIVPGVGGY